MAKSAAERAKAYRQRHKEVFVTGPECTVTENVTKAYRARNRGVHGAGDGQEQEIRDGTAPDHVTLRDESVTAERDERHVFVTEAERDAPSQSQVIRHIRGLHDTN